MQTKLVKFKLEQEQIVAEDDEEAVLGSVDIITNIEDYYYLADLYVEPEFREQGLGTKLMQSVLTQYTSKPIVLHIDKEMDQQVDRLVEFYSRLGFYITESSKEKIKMEISEVV